MATNQDGTRGRRDRVDDVPPQARRSGRARWIVIAALVAVAGAVAWMVTHRDSNVPPQPLSAAEARRDGLALYDKGLYAAAVRAYEHALSLEDDPATRTNLGNALKKVGRFDDAEEQYRRVLSRNHRDATAWYDLGNLLRDQRHDRRGAVEAYRNATEFGPQMAEPHFSLGMALMDLNDFEAAAAEIDAALQLAPEKAPWREDAVKALALARLRAVERKGLLPPPRK